MASKRTRIVVGVLALVVLGGVVAFSVTKDRRNKIPVQTQKVARRDLISTVSASGEIKPKKFVNVAADISGRITDLYVKEGDTVRTGQMLARIDATRLQAGKEQSEAAVEAARADLKRAEADVEAARLAFERNKKMHADKLISESQMDQADADLLDGGSSPAKRRRVVRKTVVVAPMTGVVTSLQKEQGESVIGAQSFSPTVIMTVGDTSAYEVEILVDETDIRYVALGQPAEVRVDALEGLKLKGEVTEIGSSAIPRGSATASTQTTSATANQAKDFKVTVTLKDPPAALRSGLNATAEITTAKKEKVLAIPIQAVVVREVSKEGKVVDPAALQASEGDPSGGAPRQKGDEREGVFVLNGGQVAFRPVKTGIIGETDIEVTDGLKEGDEIVTGSYKTLRTLKDQAKVKVDVKKDQGK